MSKIIFTEEVTKPPAPSVNQVSMYVKTDEVVYIQDSAGTEIPLGSAAAITQLTGDVSAIGPGSAVATVNFVGGQSAASIALSVIAYLAATSSNVVNTLVLRDGSGNFASNIITANNFIGPLTGNASTATLATNTSNVGSASASQVVASTVLTQNATSTNTSSTLVLRDASGNFSANIITSSLIGNVTGNVTGNVSGSSSTFTGSLSGDVTGTQSATSILSTVVTGKFLTGYVSGPNSIILATDTILQALEKLQAQVSGTSGSAITQLTGDVTATGPGSAIATVVAIQGNSVSATVPTNAQILVFSSGSSSYNPESISGDISLLNTGVVTVNTVGGSSAANIHSAELLANAATSANSASTIVKRDASGNFNANIITATLSGNATNINGLLAIANGGTNSSAALSNNRVMISLGGAIVEASAITPHRALISNANGIPTASVTTDTEIGFVSGVTSSIQAQLNAISGSGITQLTGDVSATGPGSVPATVNSVGGSTAANIHSAELLANAATNLDTVSTIVKRDASGNFNATNITANLTGNISGSATSFTGSLIGDVTGTQGSTVVSAIQGTAVSGTTGSGSVVFSANPTLTGILNGSSAIFTSTVTASNISGSNTGDVTVINSNSINLSFTSGQSNLQANLNLSTDAADAGNLKATTTIHAASGAGLHVEYPFGTPVQVGTSNSTGGASGFALYDHVHSHGNQTVSTLHAVATDSLNGFMSAVDKTKLDAATSSNTASTLVLRDASGNFSAGIITASLNGNAATATSSTSFSGSLSGDITGTQSATVVSKIQGTAVSGTTGTGNVVFSAAPTLTGLLNGSSAVFTSTISASNLSGTNNGDVTLTAFGTTPNANGASLSGQVLTLQPADGANPGGVSTGAQTLAGNKTFSGQTAVSNTSTTALTVNTNAFIVDATNKIIGVGVTPDPTVAIVDVVNTTGGARAVQTTGYAGSTGYRGRYANGTIGSPSAVLTGNTLNFISGRGYGATAFASASTAAVSLIAAETFTDSSMRTYVTVNTTPTGSVTSAESFRVDSTGTTLGPQSASTAIHSINGGLKVNTRTITTNLTVDTTTTDYLILCNNSGAITITLPTPTIGRTLIIKDIAGSSNTNNITIARHASESIEGLAANFIFQTNWGTLPLYSDGTNWYVGT